MADRKDLIREEILGSRKYEYFYQSGGLSFSTAQAECAKQDADLIHLKDEASLKRATSFLLTQNKSYWWIGLRKSRSTNVWHWTDGEQLNESVISMTGDMEYTDCAALLNPGTSKRIHLYGLDCRTDTPRHFICEGDITSSLATTIFTSTAHLTTNSQTHDPPTALDPRSSGSAAAMVLSGALLVFALFCLIFRLCRRQRSYKEAPEETSTKTECTRVSKLEDADYVDMAPRIISPRRDLIDADYEYIDDGGGYAAIGPVVKNEGNDRSYADINEGGDDITNNNEKGEVVYTQVFTIRRSEQVEREELNSMDIYAKISKKK